MERKRNTGSLFKNDRKQLQNQPDYTGHVDIEGSDYRLSAWIRVAKSGKKYMAISASPADQQRAPIARSCPVDPLA